MATGSKGRTLRNCSSGENSHGSPKLALETSDINGPPDFLSQWGQLELEIRFHRNLVYWEAKRGITRTQLLIHMGVDSAHFDRAVKMSREEKVAYLHKMSVCLSVPLSTLFALSPDDYYGVRSSWRRE
jgi:hypothetical protein